MRDGAQTICDAVEAEMRLTWPQATLTKARLFDYDYQVGAGLEINGRLYLAREERDGLSVAGMIRSLRNRGR